MIRFATINIEGHRHLDRVIPFLQKEQLEVVCLQEVFEEDLPELTATLQAQAIFAPMALVTQSQPDSSENFTGTFGVAILSKYPILDDQQAHYVGDENAIPEFIDGQPNSLSRVLLQAELEVEGKRLCVATTHFTWTPDGSLSQEQLDNFSTLQPLLEEWKPDLFCGDLNSPRGGKGIFDTLAQDFIDNIPPEATTSIDGSLHKAGNLQLMVDALFTRPSVQAKKVTLHTGVSDHQAVTAELSLV